MATTCRPRQSMRCWQYKESSDLIPRWVVPRMQIEDKKVVFLPRGDSSEEVELEEGDWIVEFTPEVMGVYADKDFIREFDLCAEAGYGG